MAAGFIRTEVRFQCTSFEDKPPLVGQPRQRILGVSWWHGCKDEARFLSSDLYGDLREINPSYLKVMIDFQSLATAIEA